MLLFCTFVPQDNPCVVSWYNFCRIGKVMDADIGGTNDC